MTTSFAAPPYQQMREHALDLFSYALEHSSIPAAFARHISYSRGVLRVCEDLYDLNSYTRIFIVSIGKAAHSMAAALAEQIGSLASGIVAVPENVSGQIPGFRYFQGGHPLPNAESIRAAEAILKSLSALDRSSLAIFLISGGGSAVVEKPIDDEISLDDIIAAYRVLVHSGAPIREINAVRKHLSRTKGGRMALAAGQAQQLSIMVSDVPENALDALASGPTMPDSSTVEDCYRIAEQYGLAEQFPSSIAELLRKGYLEETPKKDDPAFHRARWWPILSNESVVEAAAVRAAELGFHVEIDNSCDDQDFQAAADHLLQRLRRLRSASSRVCLISGGEVTVTVPEGCGTGGRNQQFALYCAGKIASERITVLSAGTDGIDGNSPAAGAVVDGSTLARISAQGSGHSLTEVIRRCDAHTALQSVGDVVVTGATGNNLRDLRILLAY
jgi:hydroxypyruvate reductase